MHSISTVFVSDLHRKLEVFLCIGNVVRGRNGGPYLYHCLANEKHPWTFVGLNDLHIGVRYPNSGNSGTLKCILSCVQSPGTELMDLLVLWRQVATLSFFLCVTKRNGAADTSCPNLLGKALAIFVTFILL